MTGDVSVGLRIAAAVALLVTVVVWVDRLAGLQQWRAALTATVRAAVQLAAVGAVITVIFRTPSLAPCYLVVVLGAASWTSGRRLGRDRRFLASAAVAITAGAAASATVVFGVGALDVSARTAVPFVAQLVGGSMTATTLAGQRFRDDVEQGWPHVEAWLSLGATPRQAVQLMARRAASRALVPALDQTRNVGLVVLPGAYVGLLLGGASPIEAGQVQLLVLIGLLAAETIAAVLITRLLSPRFGRQRPVAA